MPSAQDYRVKAAEFTRLAGRASSPKETLIFRQRARAFRSLAESEDWVEAHRDKVVSNRAPTVGACSSAGPGPIRSSQVTRGMDLSK
jgi:hypothetical protein